MSADDRAAQPTLTAEQVERLRVGAHVRSATGEFWEILAVVPGKAGDRVYTMARWASDRGRWIYCAEPATLLRLLYSPATSARE